MTQKNNRECLVSESRAIGIERDIKTWEKTTASSELKAQGRDRERERERGISNLEKSEISWKFFRKIYIEKNHRIQLFIWINCIFFFQFTNISVWKSPNGIYECATTMRLWFWLHYYESCFDVCATFNRSANHCLPIIGIDRYSIRIDFERCMHKCMYMFELPHY